jgi:hypothetical protein
MIEMTKKSGKTHEKGSNERRGKVEAKLKGK